MELQMKSEILSEISGNRTPKIGDLDKYHTVYIITFESGHYYIGKRSTYDYKTDDYFASGILPNVLKNKGETYEREILFFSECADLAIRKETEILQKKKFYDNEMCLNCYPGSPPDLTGTIIVSKGNKFNMINPKLLEYYLEMGWERKGVKRIWVSKGNEIKFILPEEVEGYLEDMWLLGNIKSRNREFIIKNDKYKFAKKEDIGNYLQEGWERKHNQFDMKVLRSIEDNSIIKVRNSDLGEYIDKGYRHSSTVEGLIYITKNKRFKRVKEVDLESYLEVGWVRGNNTSNKIYITNGKEEKRIYKEEIDDHEGWYKGRLKKVYLNNGFQEKRVNSNDKSKINEIMHSGFAMGKLENRVKKLQIYKEDKKKKILPEDLEKYKNDGWADIYDKNIHSCFRSRTKPRNHVT
jgi:hypothetical protein